MGESVLVRWDNNRNGRGKYCFLSIIAVIFLLFSSFSALLLGISPFESNALRQVGGTNETTVVVDRPVEGISPFDGAASCIADSEIAVSASAAFLCTAGGQVLYAKSHGERLPMASITKVMTALTVIEKTEDLHRTVKISPDAVGIEGSSLYLKAGDAVTVSDLLYALMLSSANDAAVALAIETAGSAKRFVSLMNEKATSLGMTDTAFANPHGLTDDGHYTTARDYAILMSHALTVPIFKEISGTVRRDVIINGVTRSLYNHNRLLSSCEGVICGKTGYTVASGRTLVTAAERNGVTLICVTLNAPDDWNDHKRLYDAGFSRTFSTEFKATEHCLEMPIVGASGEERELTVTPAHDLKVIAVGAVGFSVGYRFPVFAYAPISRGERVGYLCVYGDNGTEFSVPLVAAEDIGAQSREGGVLQWLGSVWRTLTNKEKDNIHNE